MSPAAGGGVLASDREMIRWLNGDVLTVLLDVSNEISSPGQQSMARGAIRRIEAIVDRLRSRGPAVAELIAADKEYDAALGLVRQTEATYGKRSAAASRARAAFELASEARALALSNIEGGQQ